MLLRTLIQHIPLSPHYNQQEIQIIRDAGHDLINQLEKTQALGSLSSDLRGHINVKL